LFKKGYTPWNAGTSKTKVTIVCENCGKTCVKHLCGRTKVRFCSNKCAHEHMENPIKGRFGSAHPGWKEIKKYNLSNTIRHSQKYIDWRLMVFGRDNFTCQKCGKRGCYLEAHHIIPLRKILKENKINTFDKALDCDELWNLTNGITYCSNCHMLEDKMRNKFNRLNIIEEAM